MRIEYHSSITGVWIFQCDGEGRQVSEGKQATGKTKRCWAYGASTAYTSNCPHAPMTPLTPSTCIANTQTLSAIDHLRCPICIEILSQPVELPCRAVLCAACIIRWFTLCKYPVSLLLLGDTTRSSTHQSCLQLDFRVATGYHSVLFPLQSGNEGRNTRSAPVFSTAQDSC